MIEERYHGHVTELGEGTFTGRFEGIDGEDLELEVFFRRLSTDDLAWLLETGEGCYVDLVIQRPEGAAPGEGTATLEFPKERWTQEEIDAVRREAEALSWFFEGDAAGAPTMLATPLDVRA